MAETLDAVEAPASEPIEFQLARRLLGELGMTGRPARLEIEITRTDEIKLWKHERHSADLDALDRA